MIVQCEACRGLVKVERASVSEGGERVGLCCPACGVTSFLPTSAEAPAEGPPVDEGLRAALDALPAPPGPDERLAQGFLALFGRWGEQAAHRELLRQAAADGALPALGVRYREVLAHRPDDAMAKWAQQEIIQLAMAALPRLAPEGEKPLDEARKARQRAVLTLLVLMFLGLLSFVTFYLRRM